MKCRSRTERKALLRVCEKNPATAAPMLAKKREGQYGAGIPERKPMSPEKIVGTVFPT